MTALLIIAGVLVALLACLLLAGFGAVLWMCRDLDESELS